MKLQELKRLIRKEITEVFVSPRSHKTYTHDEWNYYVISKVYKEMFGSPIEKADGIIHIHQLKDMLNKYGAVHFQTYKTLYHIVQILKEEEYEFVGKSGRVVDYNILTTNLKKAIRRGL